MMGELSLPPIQIDVGSLVQRSVATLYSHLVTRPTGRAVRLAIESLLADAGDIALSLIDLSEVNVLDFSCADEVVAKLLLRYLDPDRPREAYFVIRGVSDIHREPIEVVLERQQLATVAQREDGTYELLGVRSGSEDSVWRVVETHGRIRSDEVSLLLPAPEDRTALRGLVRRRVVFADVSSGTVHALSKLAAGTT
tara:strand:+ start:75 stop:662 length:588 start_codon:yes stop_codon:yes gene_type:complete